LEQARRQSELAVQRMALAAARQGQRDLRARWREVAPVERGQIAEADVQQRILQLAKQAADWEQQSEEAAAARAGIRPSPKGDEEFVAVLAELSQVTADNARLAGQLAIALQQAVETARWRRLNVRSESRVSMALFPQAAAQLRQWRQAGASAWANWPAERRLADLLPRLLLLLLATALAFTGDWLLRRYGPLALRDEGTRREQTPFCSAAHEEDVAARLRGRLRRDGVALGAGLLGLLSLSLPPAWQSTGLVAWASGCGAVMAPAGLEWWSRGAGGQGSQGAGETRRQGDKETR
jgi:hypothetical protein